MNPWNVLELERDADARTIKKQYARLLKTTRPDEDPVAFQRLREAYEAALAWAQRPQTDEDEPWATDEYPLDDAADGHENNAPVFGEYATAQPAPDDYHADARIEPLAVLQPTIETAAWALAAHTDAQNLQAQYQAATEQGCAAAFQQHLLQRLLTPPHDMALLEAAIAHLQWMTPWQTLRMTAEQQAELVDALLEAERPWLEQALATRGGSAFADCVAGLARRPWLESLEARLHFQRWMMVLLLREEGWGPVDFERICTVLGWQPEKDIAQEPEFFWQQLVARWERQRTYAQMQRLLADPGGSPDSAAAWLLFTPGSHLAQLRLARVHGDELWAACERLSAQLRHDPHLLERFPQADLEGWRRLTVKPRRPLAWLWLGYFLFGLVYVLPLAYARDNSMPLKDLLLTPVVSASLFCGVGFVLRRFWGPISNAFIPFDDWLGDHLVPRWLHWPGLEIRVVRHGVPALVFGWAMAVAGMGALAWYLALLSAWVVLSPYRLPLSWAAARGTFARMLRFRSR